MRDRLRHALLIAAAVSGFAIFGAFAVYEEPGLGLGHFFYVPIILAALATGPAISAGAAVIATAMYASGVIINSEEYHRLGWERLAEEAGLPLPEGHFEKSFGRFQAKTVPPAILRFAHRQGADLVRAVGNLGLLFGSLLADGGRLCRKHE